MPPDRQEELKLRQRRIMREGRRLTVTSCERQTFGTHESRLSRSTIFEET